MDTIDRELIALLRDNARTPVLTLKCHRPVAIPAAMKSAAM